MSDTGFRLHLCNCLITLDEIVGSLHEISYDTTVTSQKDLVTCIRYAQEQCRKLEDELETLGMSQSKINTAINNLRTILGNLE